MAMSTRSLCSFNQHPQAISKVHCSTSFQGVYGSSRRAFCCVDPQIVMFSRSRVKEPRSVRRTGEDASSVDDG